MSSERVHAGAPGRLARGARRVARLVAGSLLAGGLALALGTSAGCIADQEFKCCECTFPTCVDGSGTAAPQDVCACTQSFTYEECGLYCRDAAPIALFNQGLQSCGTATNSMAKDSCSTGSPVGRE